MVTRVTLFCSITAEKPENIGKYESHGGLPVKYDYYSMSNEQLSRLLLQLHWSKHELHCELGHEACGCSNARNLDGIAPCSEMVMKAKGQRSVLDNKPNYITDKGENSYIMALALVRDYGFMNLIPTDDPMHVREMLEYGAHRMKLPVMILLHEKGVTVQPKETLQ